MIKTLKIAAAALNQTPLAWQENAANIIEAIGQARASGVSILCLPELCLSGYGCEDAFFAAGTSERAMASLLQILPETRGLVISVGLPIIHQGAIFNAVCLLADCKILGFVAKQFLCNEGIHYEPRWFKAWPKGLVSEIKIENKSYPVGDLCFSLNDVIIGFEICEDAWVANRPGCRLSESQVDIILNPSASHFAFSKLAARKSLVLEGSRAFSCTYLYANMLGNESGRAIYDGGCLIANCGQLLSSGQRLLFQDVVLTEAVVDLDLARLQRSRKAKSAEDIVFEAVRVIECDAALSFVNQPQSKSETNENSWENSKSLKSEEFLRAVALGLFDYLRKSGSQGFVLSLSGGADSSAVACLVRFSMALALQDLGADGLRKKLAFLPAFSDLDDLISKILTTVYQASANSGEVTRKAAAQLARVVASEHHEISVAELVNSYTQLVESTLGRKLSWESDDLALQNIQARVRGPGVWMLANIKNALLLATSNRSEVAVGYATMDGDTCGSLSPIAGVDKAFIRQWLIWLEKEGPAGFGPIPALSAVNEQQPTAELRPGGNQTDEGDLMPYEVLEVIERAAIRDKKEPKEIISIVKTAFPASKNDECLHWVKLFFTLWSRSQWKRERYAPSFHLDDESLDPKTWCRYPILSGCFRLELSEL